MFDVDRKLLVMRPYQIVATEQILQRIITSTNARRVGTPAAGGYIWHTTGSGKTLTSFKTAQLARDLPAIDKVLFVVDRKDLDYQTMKEYERFEKGAANSNTSTAILKKQLENPNARIIITTIQKLSNFIGKNPKHPIYDAHVVIIFDECHRSQFGDMHGDITNAFKRYHLFGFTGTPIFSENAPGGSKALLCTTEKAFGDKLHTYTIVDAINDKNVLPFRVDYINTIKASEHIRDKQVSSIDTEQALLAPARITQIVAYIREHFDQKTRRTTFYSHKGKRLSGFNSLFATASIEAAKRYYLEFSNQQKKLPPTRRLKVGLIYSFAANEETADGALSEEECSTEGLDASSRDFLENVIKDYNQMFSSNFDTSADKFQNYYKDLSLRLKNRELDMVIVVNMFLTGFDATTLNTLWVDKNLRAMQEDNNKKLDDMRQIVDEKLQKTLSERMNESFKLVNERLEQVYKGLGEMQTLAQGVGDLKKVLTNVKTRGIVGEIQLGAILEDILAPEQYETNVATVPNSRNVVEYAVKLPVEDGSFVWLPIDSKFPGDTYGALRDAYEEGSREQIDACVKQLIATLKSEAKDIHDKYLAPPHTTEFGIMSCRSRDCMPKPSAAAWWRFCSATTMSIWQVRVRWRRC